MVVPSLAEEELVEEELVEEELVEENAFVAKRNPLSVRKLRVT